MNAEQLKKLHSEFNLLEIAKERINHAASIKIDGYRATVHLHYEESIMFSFSLKYDFDVAHEGYMRAELDEENGLVFLHYGEYSKVDEYIIKKEFLKNISMA